MRKQSLSDKVFSDRAIGMIADLDHTVTQLTQSTDTGKSNSGRYTDARKAAAEIFTALVGRKPRKSELDRMIK